MLKSKRLYLSAALLLLSGALIAAVSVGSEPLRGNGIKAKDNAVHFSDTAENDWYFSDVRYVYEKNIMNGMSETEFSPHGTMTRGMLTTVLWRLEGEPKTAKKSSFTDVEPDAYYCSAVTWASENEIVNGYDNTVFAPENLITREQAAAVLYRYSMYKKYDMSPGADISGFEDFGEISGYAADAFRWAYGNGIITGVTPQRIDPKGNMLRAQAAAVLKRFCEKITTGDKETEQPSETQLPAAETSDRVPASGGGSSSGGGSQGSAEDVVQPVIKVNTSYGKPGDIITVSIDLQKNPGILGMVLSMEYDETAMTLLSAENGEAVSEVLALTTSGSLNSGARFVWDGLDIDEEDIRNGTLLNLEFELSSGAEIGKRYPLKLAYESGDIVDADLNTINPRIIQGYVEIESAN